MTALRKLARLLAIAALLALATAAAASAATVTIGEDVNNAAVVTTVNDCALPCTCTHVQVIETHQTTCTQTS